MTVTVSNMNDRSKLCETSLSSSPPKSPSSVEKIRSRYLHKIGISPGPASPSSSPSRCAPLSTNREPKPFTASTNITITNNNNNVINTSATPLPTNVLQPLDANGTLDANNNGGCLGHVFATSEPLKTGGLDSDDDSSMSSSSFDSDDGDFFIGSLTSQDSEEGKLAYFPKPPIDPIASKTTNVQLSYPTSGTNGNDGALDASSHSVPALAASCDGSVTSTIVTIKSENNIQEPPFSRTRGSIGCYSNKNNQSSSSLSNKRPRLGTDSNHHRRSRGKRSVSLHKSVSVIPIPSRDEYSLRVKERLWSSSAELCANAARNSIEFASEGWNWRHVLEDDEMLVHKPSGELIHPIHLQNAFASMGQNELAGSNNKVHDKTQATLESKCEIHSSTINITNGGQ